MSVLLLTVGLAAKEPQESIVATDAAIAAITDGQLNGSDLGEMFRSVLSTGLFKVARWANSLKAISRSSILHAEVIRAALAQVFTGETAFDVRDLAQLLEIFYELTLETGQPIPQTTLEWLSRFQGSGKGAKAVKQLLAFNSQIPMSRILEWQAIAISGRTERVKRWMRFEQ